MAFLNRDKQAMHPPIYAKKSLDGVEVELALQWCAARLLPPGPRPPWLRCHSEGVLMDQRESHLISD